MPILSRFYGIIIRMYFRGVEHNPPHIHAIYGEDIASISIIDFSIIAGDLPKKAHELVITWMKEHQNELMEMWNTQIFKPISPLE